MCSRNLLCTIISFQYSMINCNIRIFWVRVLFRVFQEEISSYKFRYYTCIRWYKLWYIYWYRIVSEKKQRASGGAGETIPWHPKKKNRYFWGKFYGTNSVTVGTNWYQLVQIMVKLMKRKKKRKNVVLVLGYLTCAVLKTK